MRRLAIVLATLITASLATWLPSPEVRADGGGWSETWGGGIDDIVLVNATDRPLKRTELKNNFFWGSIAPIGINVAAPLWLWGYETKEFRASLGSAAPLEYLIKYELTDPTHPGHLTATRDTVVIHGFNDGVYNDDKFNCFVETPGGQPSEFGCLAVVDDGYPRKITVVVMNNQHAAADAGTPEGRALAGAVAHICTEMDPDNALCDFVPDAGEPERTTAWENVGPRVINCHSGAEPVSMSYASTWSHNETITTSHGAYWGGSIGVKLGEVAKVKATYNGWYDDAGGTTTTYSMTTNISNDVNRSYKQLTHKWERIAPRGSITVSQHTASYNPTTHAIEFGPATASLSVTGTAFAFPQPLIQDVKSYGDRARPNDCPSEKTELTWVSRPTPAMLGGSAALTVEVVPVHDGGGELPITGTVTFTQAGRVLCADVAVVDRRARCETTLDPIRESDSVIIASYSGDASWEPDTTEVWFTAPSSASSVPIRTIGSDTAEALGYLVADECPGTSCDVVPVATYGAVERFMPVTLNGAPVGEVATCNVGRTGEALSWTSGTHGYKQYGHMVGAGLELNFKLVSVSAEAGYRTIHTESFADTVTHTYNLSVPPATAARLEAATRGYDHVFDLVINFSSETVIVKNARRFVPIVGNDGSGLSTSVRAITRPMSPDECPGRGTTTTVPAIDAIAGREATVTAHVRSVDNQTVDVGTVTFSDDTGTLCADAAVVASKATCTFLPTSTGVRQLTARYSGYLGTFESDNLHSSSGSMHYAVKYATTLSVAVEDLPGGPALVATVSGGSPPSGLVGFFWSSGYCSAAVTAGRAVACAGAPTTGGNTRLWAIYTGDQEHPAVRWESPTPVELEPSVTFSPQPGAPLEHTFSARLEHSGDPTKPPHLGDLVVTTGGQVLCRATVGLGIASCSGSLDLGEHVVTFAYEDSSVWSANPVEQVVKVEPLATQVVAEVTNRDFPSTQAHEIVVSGSVTAPEHPAMVVAGEVTVSAGGAELCRTTIADGAFTCSTAVDAARLDLAVEYPGSANYRASSAAITRTPPPASERGVAMGAERACAYVPAHGAAACFGLPETPAGTPAADAAMTKLAISRSHACGLLVDRRVACWGSDPYAVTPSGEFIDIDTADDDNLEVACGVRVDGRLTCWGTGYRYAPPTGTFTQIALGTRGGCALRTNRQVACFGQAFGYAAQLTGEFMTVDVGGAGACGVRTDGRLVCVASGPGSAWLSNIPEPNQYSSVSVGTLAACALTFDGQYQCWGIEGQRRSLGWATYTSIATGYSMGCATTTDHRIECWFNVLNDYPGGPEAMEPYYLALVNGASAYAPVY